MTVAEPDTAALYGLPLGEFTQQRDHLVRRLREEGRREEAAEVASLRKPTTDAWALNQVARREPDQIEGLLEAHRALREADDGDSFRQASASRHRLVDQILDTAARLLAEGGHSAAGSVTDRISRTLLAAAADPETEAALRGGVLTRSVDFSVQWPGTFAPAPVRTEEEDATSREEVERLGSRAEELASRAEELRRAANQTREALDEARRHWEEAEQEARAAERLAKTAREEAKKAQRRLR